MSPDSSPVPAFDPPGTPPPSRVLVLVDTLVAGGAERLAVELACSLDRARFDPHVVVTRTSGPLADHLQRAGVPCTVLGRTRRFDVSAWRRVRRLVASADIVHAHKFGSNVWGSLLARRTGTPLVAHEHNFAGCDSRLGSLIDRWLVGRSAARVVCVSDSVAATQSRHGVSSDKLVVVANGVRLEAAWPRSAARAELGLDDHETVIGIVGRLRPEKAHDVLLDALALLRDEGRAPRLCIVGEGPCGDALRARVDRLGLGELVTFAGERHDAARLAAAFDASIVCSHWEGLPLAALESLAAGVPLVASAVGGLPDLVAPGGADAAGTLVPPGDPRALASAIATLLADPAAMRDAGRAGTRRVRERYGFLQMVGNVQRVYDEVLGERRRARTPRGPWHDADIASAEDGDAGGQRAGRTPREDAA